MKFWHEVYEQFKEAALAGAIGACILIVAIYILETLASAMHANWINFGFSIVMILIFTGAGIVIAFVADDIIECKEKDDANKS